MFWYVLLLYQKQADKVRAGWADSDVGWKLAEQLGPEGGDEWHEV